jgi:hypothetical protein
MKGTRPYILIGLGLPLLLGISGCGIGPCTDCGLAVTATPSTIALGRSSQLDVSTSGSPRLQCSWDDPSNTLNDTTICDPTATPTVATTYDVVATNSAKPHKQVTGQVTVHVTGYASFTLTVIGADNVGGVSSTPLGIGFGCGATCSTSFATGTTVVLTAETGRVHWSGCDSVDGNTAPPPPQSTVGSNCSVMMNAKRTVTVSP